MGVPLWTPNVSQSKFYLDQKIPPVSTQATFVSEDDGDWWAGIQQFGAAVTLAAVLISSSFNTLQVSSYHQDELPLQEAVEEGYQPTSLPVSLNYRQIQPWEYDSAEFPPLQTAIVDIEDWSQPSPVQIIGSQQQFYESGEFPQQAATIVEEDYWLNQVPVPLSVYQQSLQVYDSGELAIAPQEEDRPQAAGVYYGYQSQLFTDSSDFVSQPTTAIEEDYWNNPMAHIPFIIVYRQPWFYDAEDFIGSTPILRQNYIDPGVHNYVSQEIGTGVKY